MKNRTHRMHEHARTLQRGFIVAYLLFGISLLSVVALGMSAMSRQQSDAYVTQQRREELINDALLLRTAIRTCALLYPAGNNGDANSAVQYPRQPASGSVADLVCPGSTTGSTTGETIWATLTRSGAASMSPPPRRIGMSGWIYINRNRSDGTPEVRIAIEPDTPGNGRSADLLRSLARNSQLSALGFTSSEVTGSGGALTVRLSSSNLATQ